jgi:cob(I)alamin adenosyltransferase
MRSHRYAATVKIYTRAGDDGTTGLYFGGRTSKGDVAIDLNGTVDEAQAMLGWARALSDADGEINERLVLIERDLWVLMAEVATLTENRRKLVAGKTLVTQDMVDRLESGIDDLADRTTTLKDFVVPGENQLSAALDVARTVVRRAERVAINWTQDGSLVSMYLNRLSDYVWSLARFAEGDHHLMARTRVRRTPTEGE